MLISTSLGFVFVANTKTASTSIEQVLRPHAQIVHEGTPARKHISLTGAMEAYPALFGRPENAARFFKFGVMRDPIDWIGSWYRYRSGNQVETPLPEGMTFAEFWQRKDWNIRHPDGSGKYLQRDVFCDASGAVLADVILPYDRLGALFAEICECLGMSVELPRQNISRKTAMPDTVPEELRDELREFYAEDYALLAQLETLNNQGMARLRDLTGVA